jgi:hypothetical protein
LARFGTERGVGRCYTENDLKKPASLQQIYLPEQAQILKQEQPTAARVAS